MKSKDKVGYLRDYRYSIKQRISTTYVFIYLLICVMMGSIFFIGYMGYTCDEFSQESVHIAAPIVDAYLGGIRGDDSTLSKIINEQVVGTEADIIAVYDADGKLIDSTIGGSGWEKYQVATNNILTTIFPQFAMIQEGYFIDNFAMEDSGINIDIYYSLLSFSDEYGFVMKLFLFIMTAGLLIFVAVGNARMSSILMPINEMTEVAEKINVENLQIRLDEKSPKYELHDLASTINSMMDRIESSYDKQKQFVSDVSHELRTPIAVISGYANMLKRWGKDDKEILEESIEAIQNETESMNKLVESLLMLTRHDNNTLQFEKKCVSISDLCEETLNEMEFVYPDFVLDKSIEKGIKIKADRDKIKQLLRIFFENAVKYSLDEKRIVFRLQKESEYIYMSIKDFGLGIEKKDLANIFDRFYRADESRAKATGGTGLGLAMAKAIVTGHKGKIKVITKPNEGSEFIIIFKVGD